MAEQKTKKCEGTRLVYPDIFRSPFHSMICSYLLFAVLVASLAFWGPTSSGANTDVGGELPSRIDASIDLPAGATIVLEETVNTAPHCNPELSLAGRELAIDAAATPHMGTLQFPDAPQLNAKEVLLTFDDGPHPQRTYTVLDILDRFCVKGVFFAVGEMALEHPDVLQEVARRGHVIGTHSFTHPHSLARMEPQRAKAEIEMGFAAVALTLDGPVAPLFRFPGFNQAPYLLDYLAEKKVSVWSVDIVSGDSEFVSASNLPNVMFRRLHAQDRGMILFHDIKKATTERLTDILQQLKDEGYTAVRPSIPASFIPDEAVMAMLDQAKNRQRELVHQVAQKFYTAPVAVR